MPMALLDPPRPTTTSLRHSRSMPCCHLHHHLLPLNLCTDQQLPRSHDLLVQFPELGKARDVFRQLIQCIVVPMTIVGCQDHA
jgi:hypothetical protein